MKNKDTITVSRRQLRFSLLFLIALCLLLGLYLGSQMEKIMLSAMGNYIFKDSDFKLDVNFNSTELAYETKSQLVPAFTYMLNQTVIREFGNCRKVEIENGLFLLNCTKIKDVNT